MINANNPRAVEECDAEALAKENPEDFVISTNEAHSVREFIEAAFKEIDREIM